MVLPESLEATSAGRIGAGLILAWLAVFFGRTLRAGQVPLIERIARVGDPALEPQLCRYTRRLTMLWCAYFGVASVLCLVAAVRPASAGLPGHPGSIVFAGTVVLFVGERMVRPLFFRGKRFPGLWAQIQATWSVWHR